MTRSARKSGSKGRKSPEPDLPSPEVFLTRLRAFVAQQSSLELKTGAISKFFQQPAVPHSWRRPGGVGVVTFIRENEQLAEDVGLVLAADGLTLRAVTPPRLARYCFVDTIDGAAGAVVELLAESGPVAVDMEGDLSAGGSASLLSLQRGRKAFTMDILTCPELLGARPAPQALPKLISKARPLPTTSPHIIGAFLSDPSIVTVFHDFRADVRALATQFGVFVQHPWDVQVAEIALTGNPRRERAKVIVKRHVGTATKRHYQRGRGVWEQRPLPVSLLGYAVTGVEFLSQVHAVQLEQLGDAAADVYCRSLELANESIQRAAATVARKQKGTKKASSRTDNSPRVVKPKRRERLSRKAGAAGERAPGAGAGAGAGAGSDRPSFRGLMRNKAFAEANGKFVGCSSVDFQTQVAKGGKATTQLLVENHSSGPIGVTVALMRPGGSCFSVRVAAESARETFFHVKPKSHVEVHVDCSPSSFGVQRDLIEVIVHGLEEERLYRVVELRSVSPAVFAKLQPTAPYKPRKKAEPFRAAKVVPPAKRKTSRPAFKHGLAGFRVPARWRAPIDDAAHDQMADSSYDLCLETYTTHLQSALWVEEVEAERQLLLYSMTAPLDAVGNLFSLVVPGLLEGRPSVIVGDVVRVRVGDSDTCFEGRTEKVLRDAVHLRFARAFSGKYQPGVACDVQFVLSRTQLRLQHQGVTLAPKMLPRLLWPELVEWHPRQGAADFPWGRHAHLNKEQRAAVDAITAGTLQHTPYVVFGPPGTGKTVTLVAAVEQLLRLPPPRRGAAHECPGGLRVLVCAPTNTAVDVIVARLAAGDVVESLPDKPLLRGMAFSRHRNDTPQTILPFTKLKGEQFDDVLCSDITRPGLRVYAHTLAGVAKLYNQGLPKGTFDVMVVDEAAQATEPLFMAAAVAAVGDCTQVVLAGDPCQLGPVVHSGLAEDAGLDESYLERLCAQSIYRRGEDGLYDPRVLTKLVRNYRSHAAILRPSNDLFYEQELMACGPPHVTDSMVGTAWLPRPSIPIMWHGVEGKCEREASSPSWFNADEAMVVQHYVTKLLRPTEPAAGAWSKVKPSDIGVITPYQRQAHKLRAALRATGIRVDEDSGVKVGTTEVFQGQERRIIIISTVRSDESMLGEDTAVSVGFVGNPQRMNVAVTRARALVIVVGNPRVFAKDEWWGRWLEECISLGCFCGQGLPIELSGNTSEADEAYNALHGFLDTIVDKQNEAARRLEA